MLSGILVVLGMAFFLLGLALLFFIGLGMKILGVNPWVGFWHAGLKFWLTSELTWFIVIGITFMYFGYRFSAKKASEDIMNGEKA